MLTAQALDTIVVIVGADITGFGACLIRWLTSKITTVYSVKKALKQHNKPPGYARTKVHSCIQAFLLASSAPSNSAHLVTPQPTAYILVPTQAATCIIMLYISLKHHFNEHVTMGIPVYTFPPVSQLPSFPSLS